MPEVHYFIGINLLIFPQIISQKEYERKLSGNTDFPTFKVGRWRFNSPLSVSGLTLNDLVFAKCVTTLMLFKCGMFCV